MCPFLLKCPFCVASVMTSALLIISWLTCTASCVCPVLVAPTCSVPLPSVSISRSAGWSIVVDQTCTELQVHLWDLTQLTLYCVCVCHSVTKSGIGSSWEHVRTIQTETRHHTCHSLLPLLTCFHASTLAHSLLYKPPSSVSLSTVHEGCVCVSIHLGLAGFTAVVPVLQSALHPDKDYRVLVHTMLTAQELTLSCIATCVPHLLMWHV